jgi:hypothetical protein
LLKKKKKMKKGKQARAGQGRVARSLGATTHQIGFSPHAPEALTQHFSFEFPHW